MLKSDLFDKNEIYWQATVLQKDIIMHMMVLMRLVTCFKSTQYNTMTVYTTVQNSCHPLRSD